MRAAGAQHGHQGVCVAVIAHEHQVLGIPIATETGDGHDGRLLILCCCCCNCDVVVDESGVDGGIPANST